MTAAEAIAGARADRLRVYATGDRVQVRGPVAAAKRWREILSPIADEVFGLLDQEILRGIYTPDDRRCDSCGREGFVVVVVAQHGQFCRSCLGGTA